MGISVTTLLILLSSVDGTSPSPPASLVCLARHYNLTPAFENGIWVAILPSGTRIPFDDGKPKSFDQRLESPDIEDMFAIPYPTGPIHPVETENEDPGRIRIEALFAATYRSQPKASALTWIRFLGSPVRVHRKIAAALGRVAERLERARRTDPRLVPFLRRLSGGYVERKIAGTDRASAHAFGVAIDLDTALSDYWRWQKNPPLRWRNRIPQAIVDAFEAEGFIWGGRWYHYDTMHFEYRPELFGPPCREVVTAASDTQSR
jgi:hypothetical protein